MSEKEYSNRFPSWIFEGYPANKYMIIKSRKLFGKQRYAITPGEGEKYNRLFHNKYDFKSIEEATPWLNSINVYAKIIDLFDSGEHDLIREIDLQVTGDSPQDQEGYSIRSILANILHSDPEYVVNALEVLDVE